MEGISLALVVFLTPTMGRSPQVASITANDSEGAPQPDASYILRACIPVPSRTMLTAPGAVSSLRIAESNGNLSDDTQVEMMSRYADPVDRRAPNSQNSREMPEPSLSPSSRPSPSS